MQEDQNFLDSLQGDAQVKSYLEQQKFGRIDNSGAQSLNWDLRIGKQSPIRYHGAKFGSLKIRDETKLLKADMESFPGIWHKYVKSTMELLKSPSPFKRFGIAE